ncbi:alpha/beta hydrolase [Aestuariibaculum suncheonense]|uniref:Esterase family protein n=1 Tax=Aestuariibaculum suncheonense TaxID=1028745 RepID=A0A8J6UAK1_9FLAO|nr:alpha/beta hydrolase family protein [Aestuariibaculum suncheonense]MBD0835393.1 esterase family protein [Aestuariibaculum suncheonense]
MKSVELNQDIKYTIYLPSDYAKSNEDYSVFYLLHGFTNNENTWIDNGWVDIAEVQGVLENGNDKMIIVMPDGGNSWFVNHPNGKFNYENMFFKEFIPYIESIYQIKSDRANRFIGGLSMGGYGALGYTMRHIDMFSVCVAFSSAIRTDENTLSMTDDDFDYLYGSVYNKNIKDFNRISEHWNLNNPLYLVHQLSDNQLKSVKWYLSCGDKDYLLDGNIEINRIFRNRDIPHEFRIEGGHHNWDYWRLNIDDGLKFISEVK